jgi:DNA-binding CsgD family transcriptional regulator
MLTPLQSEILKGIAEGKPIKVIAKELGIAPRIVERHRADLKRRFDLKQSRGDASIRAQVVREECLGLGVASEPESSRSRKTGCGRYEKLFITAIALNR